MELKEAFEYLKKHYAGDLESEVVRLKITIGLKKGKELSFSESEFEEKKPKVRRFNQQDAFGILCCYADGPRVNDIMDYEICDVSDFYGSTEDVVPEKERGEYKDTLTERFGAF